MLYVCCPLSNGLNFVIAVGCIVFVLINLFLKKKNPRNTFLVFLFLGCEGYKREHNCARWAHTLTVFLR